MWAYDLLPSHKSHGQPRRAKQNAKTERTQEVIDSIRSSLKKRAVLPPFAAFQPRFA
jgi:hypothetical protein